jgi:hypothetical protein
LLLPPPHPPLLLHEQYLHTASQPARARIQAAAAQAITDADINPNSHLAAIVVFGGGAHLPALATALAHHYRHIPTINDQPRLATARGLLTATPPAATIVGGPPAAVTTPDPPTPPAHTPPTATVEAEPPGLGLSLNLPIPPRVARAGAILAPAIASGLLLVESIATATLYPAGGYSTGPGFLLINATEYSMAALDILLTALFTATLLAATLLADPTPEAHTHRRAGKLLYRAAAIAILLAATYGLIVAAAYGVPPGPHIRWCLLATVPIAAIATAIGLWAPRQPGLTATNWATPLHQPLTPILLAAAGMLAAEAALNLQTPIPLTPGYRFLAGHAGAGILAIAIVLTITEYAWPRLIGGTAAFLGAGIFFNGYNIHTLGQIYIIAVIAWWITHTARLAHHAITNRPQPPPNQPAG